MTVGEVRLCYKRIAHSYFGVDNYGIEIRFTYPILVLTKSSFYSVNKFCSNVLQKAIGDQSSFYSAEVTSLQLFTLFFFSL